MSMQAPLPPLNTAFQETAGGQIRITWAWVQWFLQLEKARTATISGSYITDTHANRLANYPVANYPPSTEFRESDRQVFYINNGTAWLYQSGIMLALAAARPNDLSGNDSGLTFIATDTGVLSVWNGFAFVTPTATLPAIVDALTFVLQLNRGLKAALPASLPVGSPYYATDTFELYFGTGAGTHKVEADANSIQGIAVSSVQPTTNGKLLIYDQPSNSYIPGDPIVSGTAADGSAPLGAPVRVAGTGTDNLVHTVATDLAGVVLEDSRVINLLEKILLELRSANLLLAQLKDPGNSSQYPNLTDSVGTLQ